MIDPIDRFVGKYQFLSNFWSCKIKYLGKTYPSVEHAFQAAKATKESERETIRKLVLAKDAKRLGRKVTLRKDWESVKINIMEMLIEQKFKDPELRGWLLETGDAELIEGNHWGDTFWGKCEGQGLNQLGRILMTVRRRIRDEQCHDTSSK